MLEGKDLPEDGLRERNDGTAAQTLEDSGHDQRGQIGGGAGDERADDEERCADQEESPPPEEPDQPSGGRDDHGIGGKIGGDHPRHLVQPRGQRALQMGEDDVGDAGVEDLHEGHHHDRDGDGPLAGRRDRGRVRGWSSHGLSHVRVRPGRSSAVSLSGIPEIDRCFVALALLIPLPTMIQAPRVSLNQDVFILAARTRSKCEIDQEENNHH